MLLQTDRYQVQGASTAGAPAAGTVSGPGLLDGSGRARLDGARVPRTDHDKWLVGLRFHTAGHRPVWLYYVMDEACDTTQAVRLALQRAGSDPDRVTRGGVRGEADGFEVRQIHRDALGRFNMTRRPPPSRP